MRTWERISHVMVGLVEGADVSPFSPPAWSHYCNSIKLVNRSFKNPIPRAEGLETIALKVIEPRKKKRCQLWTVVL
ncbi:hypothetical protein I7I50_11817 [Histoplasma capsulatum G186AR]|nr:hypothetical protein I7I50_11817 [Histoplasma capsulatum G186AR]